MQDACAARIGPLLLPQTLGFTVYPRGFAISHSRLVFPASRVLRSGCKTEKGKHMKSTKTAGFTLIELMIVVVIISIIAAVAVPSYQDHVRTSRITDATSLLATKRVQVEQFFQDNNTYVGAKGCENDSASSQNFNFSCNPAPTATAYTIVATGKGPMAGMSFSINESNVRRTVSVPGWSGWSTPATNCWIRGKGGIC